MDSPDQMRKVRDLFGIDSDMEVPAFSEADERVPDLDPAYVFDPDTTLAIVAGFAKNRRVMIQGYHGTGKSTHVEQVAARLNWPLIRINLDAHISRIDLIGRDAIVLREGQQVTEFREGLLPWALQTPTALVFDEYDAGRPDVMFVIQRVLEAEGKLTLLEGDPGLGKSWLTCAIACAVSHGKGLPNAAPFEAGNVLMLSAEDGLGDTLRPRLDAVGADVRRVFALDEPLTLDAAGLVRLEAAIIRPLAKVISRGEVQSYAARQLS